MLPDAARAKTSVTSFSTSGEFRDFEASRELCSDLGIAFEIGIMDAVFFEIRADGYETVLQHIGILQDQSPLIFWDLESHFE